MATLSTASRRIGIIGSGFSGLCLGIQLKRAGFDSFTIFEKAAGVGEIAALVAWLASEENSFTTGAAFDISGGRATY